MRIPLSIALIVAAASAFAQVGKIHPDPAKPRPHFLPHHLPFETPQDGVARIEFRSAQFYAAILKTVGKFPGANLRRMQAVLYFP